MQIFVIGMHRSGTSLTARLLNLMGAYFAPEGVSIGANQENPKGFWERRDVCMLNDRVLHSSQAEWYRVSDFSLDKIPKDALDDFNRNAQNLILEMDAHRPWFIKEPRLCLTFPLWLKHLEFPICIHVYRSPVEIAQSLRTRNGFSLQFGVALWEKYTLDALKFTKESPNLLILHSDLFTKPLQTVVKLYQKLSELGCQGLRIPHEKELLAFISTELYREKGSSELEAGFINKQQAFLVDAFKSGKILDLADKTDLTLSPGAQEILEFHEKQWVLEDAHQQLKNTVGDLQASEAALRQEGENLQAMLQSSQASEAALRQEGENLQAMLQSSQASEAALRQEGENLQAMLQSSQASEAALRQEGENLQAMLQSSQASEAALRQEGENLQAMLQSSQASEAALRQEGENLQAMLQTLEDSLRANQADSTIRQREFDQFKLSAEAQQNVLRQELEKLPAKKDALLQETEQRFNDWIRQLEKDSEALFASWRWRIGCFIVRIVEWLLMRTKVQLSSDHMRDIFKSIHAYQNPKKQDDISPDRLIVFVKNSYEHAYKLSQWMHLLKRDFEDLSCSKRWQVGNISIRLVEMLLLQPKRPLAIDHLETIFREFENWLPNQKYNEDDIQKLAVWLRKARYDFDDLLLSKRWKIGHSVISLAEKILGRGRPSLAADHIVSILSSYREWENQYAEILHALATQTPSKKNEIVSQSARVERTFRMRKAKDSRQSVSANIILYTKGNNPMLRRTLLSLESNTDSKKNSFYLIDDSPNSIPDDRIAQWSRNLPIRVIRPQTRNGFLSAVCEIMREAELGDFCILQDHVILTPDWLSGVSQAAYSSKSIGIVSPITPTHPLHGFKMKPGDNSMTCARKIRLVTESEFPGIVLPDPAVFYVKYSAVKDFLSAIPAEREDTETSLALVCLELFKKGFITVLADNTYVHVSGKLAAPDFPGSKYLLAHLNDEDLDLFQQMCQFASAQAMASQRNYYASDIKLIHPQTAAIFFSTIQVNGGVIILTELANDLILSGVNVIGVLVHPHWQNTPELFDLLFEPLLKSETDKLKDCLPDHTVLLATMWITVTLVDELAKLNPSFKPYYFIQDFEPLFYNPSNPFHQKAIDSYHFDLSFLVTSDWIMNQVLNLLGTIERPLQKVSIGIDQENFYPDPEIQRSVKGPLRLIAMTRPQTPRRGFENIVKILSIVYHENPNIQFAFFGDNDLTVHKIPFPYENLGLLTQNQLRAEYSRAHIFLDASVFQGFGLPALEAMACGCCCVLTDSGGASEYARDNVNSLLVPVGDNLAAAQAILRFASDQKLRQKIADGGRKTAEQFSIHNTARDIGGILQKTTDQIFLEASNRGADPICNIIVPIYNEPQVVKPCLESIQQHTSPPYRLFLVDDCSDSETAVLLQEFASGHSDYHYIRNDENLGFVESANAGMRATPSGDIILLNSDTIVTPGWLDKLIRCARSDDKIGIISPLSTGSSHLWIKPNPGDSILDVAAVIEQISSRDYPDVVTPEGWCFYIRRNVYEHLGGFDPIFGRGYCEESDYCMRAFANGYRMVCCDDAFIFHEGMVTFKKERGPRYEKNRAIFDNRWKPLYEKIYARFLADNPLGSLRNQYANRTLKP